MRDYPPEAIREALLNAIVHRDYSFSGATLISIFEDRIEFVTIGGLELVLFWMDGLVVHIKSAIWFWKERKYTLLLWRRSGQVAQSVIDRET